MARERSGRWLSLGEAAAWLGVDEATLRHWADTGRIRTFRTPGGHRRFLEDDLRTLMTREIPKVDDLGHLVERRSARVLADSPARPLETRAWFASLDETLRARARAYGRQVFGEVVRYVAEPAARGEIRERVLAAGRQYGVDLRDAGVTPAEAAEAFGHFRTLVLKLVTEPRGRGGMLDEEQIRTLLEVSGVLDAIFAAILRAWDRQERTAHGTPAPAGPGAAVP